MYKKLFFLILMGLIAFSQSTFASVKPTAEINKLYYNVSPSELHKFRCEVSIDIFDQMKEKSAFNLSKKDQKEINRLKFYLIYKDQRFTFKVSKYPNLSNDQLNQAINQVIDGTEKMAVGFFQLWKGTVLDTFLDETKLYEFTENETGYTATYKEAQNNVEFQFDKDYILQKLIYGSDKQNMMVIPTFTQINEGLLISQMDLDFGNGMMKEHLEIENQEIKHIYLPQTVKINVKMFQTEQNVALKFFNYKVN